MCWDQDKANEGSGDRTGGGDGDGVGNGARWHWDGGGGASDGVSDGDTSAKDDGDDLMVAMVTHSCQMSSVLILLTCWVNPQISQCDPTASPCPHGQ